MFQRTFFGKSEDIRKREMFKIAKDVWNKVTHPKDKTLKSFEDPTHIMTFSKTTLLAEIQKLYPSVIFIAYRSKNENIVVYELIRKPDKTLGVDVYWLMLDNAYRSVRRQSGILHDREELSLLDTQVAYGVTTTQMTDTNLLMRWNGSFVMKQMIPFNIEVNPENMTARAILDGHKYIRSLFIQAFENMNIRNLMDNIVALKANYIDLNTNTPHTIDALSYLNIKK